MDSGTLLTSLIAASAATIGVAVTKDSKISEFRQQWIDALREDVAKLCSVSVALYHGNIRYSLKDRVAVRLVDTDALTKEANEIGYRIRLRLDRSKPHAAELIEKMDALVHLATHAHDPFDVVNQTVEAILLKANVVIEDAWKNVRRGEPRFRWSFRISFAALISIGLGVLFWWLSRYEGTVRALIGRP